MKRVFAYIRPKPDLSIVSQQRAIERYAKRHGLTIIKWFKENNISAARPRPAFLRMLKDLKAGQAVGVITDKLDRFARRLSDQSRISELAHSGVTFYFAEHRSKNSHFVPQHRFLPKILWVRS